MSAAPTVIAQITDPHLLADDPRRARQFAAAVDAVLSRAPGLAAVLITGDVADTGAADDYAGVREQLDRFDVPVIIVPGNHDDRAALRAAAALPDGPDAPIRSVTAVAGLRIVACDTLVPGETAGDLDTAWVAEQLAVDRVTPTLIVMHHPPVLAGSVNLDAIGLPSQRRDELARHLADATNVIAIITGHVHRAVLAGIAGVPVALVPSALVQFSFDPPGAPEFHRTNAAAMVAFHLVVDGQLVTHFQPIARVD